MCTQSPIPPSHSPFPHQLQHKELVWTQLPLLPALGITLWVSHKAASPSSPSTQPTCCKQPGTNKQTKPRDLHQPALHSTTIRTPPLLHSTVYLSPYLEHQNHTQHITINACNQIPTKQGIHKHSSISDVSGQEHIPVHPSSP